MVLREPRLVSQIGRFHLGAHHAKVKVLCRSRRSCLGSTTRALDLSRQRRFLADLIRFATPAIVIVVPTIGLVYRANVRASWASLGRDQGIFQYIAWAIANGEVAYRDIRDVNGPVVAMIHLAFQALGGAEEHRFRVLDLLATGASFVVAGACLPFQRRVKLDPPVPWAASVAWALASWAVLSAQYVVYGFWNTAQRESFFDWFVLVSIALLATRVTGGAITTRGARAALMVSGALSFIPWLGKPTFALFTAVSVLSLLWPEGDTPRSIRVRRVGWFVFGGALGLVAPLAFLLLRGDVHAFMRITLYDVPTMYRFIWPRPAAVILGLPWYRQTVILGVLTSGLVGILVITRRLSVRALPIAAMPVVGLVSVVVQAKGFPYHFHPVTLGTTFGWLVALAALWPSDVMNLASKPSRGSRVAVALAAGISLVGASALAVRTELLGPASVYPEPPPNDARDARSLESAERLSAFDRVDFFPRALRDAAEFIDRRTSAEDRVQTYGMDAYLLFLAKRKSATPYVYVYDLNTDAALAGAFDPGGVHPSDEEAMAIRGIRDRHLRDFTQRIEERPPAAFVFIDRSPLMSQGDAVTDFSRHCPDAARWVDSNYVEGANFEGIRVWLRNDLASAEATFPDRD